MSALLRADLDFKQLERFEVELYSTFLRQQSHSLFFYDYAYQKLVCTHLNSELYVWIAKYAGRVLGAISVAYSQAGPLGVVANSMPYFGGNGGTITSRELSVDDDAFIKKRLIEIAFQDATKKKCASLTMISNPLDPGSFEILEEQFGSQPSDSRIGQFTTLPRSTSEDIETVLIKQFENPRPRNIRRAIKSGISVKSSNERDDLLFLWKTHKSNIEAIGGHVKKQEFFMSVYDQIDHDDWKVFVGRLDKQPISALLLFYSRNVVEYFTPATVSDFRRLQPSALVIYQAMLDAVNRGIEYWNWGGTWETQKGVYDFKKKWGALDYPYYYFTKIYNDDIFQATPSELLEYYPGFYVVNFERLNINE